MIHRFALASAAAGLMIAGMAQASELAPMAGKSIELENISGVAYYTVEADGYRVVATVASSEDATPVRFTTTLAAGQKTVISVPRALGLSAVSVEISRVGDRVIVTKGETVADAKTK